MKDFYYLAKYQMTVPGTEGAAGALILPSGIAHHTLGRRSLATLGRRLLDPQMYLGELSPTRYRKTCSKLASYPWFLAQGIATYDSGLQTQKQWKTAVEANITESWRGLPSTPEDIRASIDACLLFQASIGVEALILPSPLTMNHATDYSREIEWLEVGIERANNLLPDRPTLATVAISDTCLRGFQPDQNALIDLILDQISARSVAGAYVVLEQSNETTYNITAANTVGGLIRLVQGLKDGGLRRVMVSYAGTAGLLMLIAGADAWANGWYRSERRLRLSEIEPSEGRSMPAYYSHPAGTEFHMSEDLARVRDHGMLDRISDVTPHSQPLLSALAAGYQPSAVPTWAPTQGNVWASRAHYSTAMIRETQAIAEWTDTPRAYAETWLNNATQIAADLYQLGSFNVRTELDHQRAWLEALGSLR